MNSRYTILTCCNRVPTEDYYCLKSYFTSLDGETPIVLTESFGGRWGGLGSKVRWVYKAIKEGLIQTEFIIFTDCWDFVFARPPRHLFQKYLDWFPDTPIVISAEKNCFPDTLKAEYDALPKQSNYCYPNTGMIVGKTEEILKALVFMDAPNVPDDYWDGEKMVHPNDQFEWMKIFLQQPAPMRLDQNQLLCNTLHSVSLDDLQFEQHGIFNKETGSVPCSFHANGGAKTSGVLPPILSHLNLI